MPKINSSVTDLSLLRHPPSQTKYLLYLSTFRDKKLDMMQAEDMGRGNLIYKKKCLASATLYSELHCHKGLSFSPVAHADIYGLLGNLS